MKPMLAMTPLAGSSTNLGAQDSAIAALARGIVAVSLADHDVRHWTRKRTG